MSPALLLGRFGGTAVNRLLVGGLLSLHYWSLLITPAPIRYFKGWREEDQSPFSKLTLSLFHISRSGKPCPSLTSSTWGTIPLPCLLWSFLLPVGGHLFAANPPTHLLYLLSLAVLLFHPYSPLFHPYSYPSVRLFPTHGTRQQLCFRIS